MHVGLPQRPGQTRDAAGGDSDCVGDFKDTVVTFLGVILRVFEKCMVYEELCVCFFELGALNCIF